MKKSTKTIVILIVIILVLILLMPQVSYVKDGGSVKYKAVLYEVDKWHAMTLNEGEYWVGYTVKILGKTVYDHQETITYAEVEK
ncbi:MAG: hypothetical protein IJN34_02990 [Clostridia bacterium]|nr:hypothetical protein [Clostridia bacterium]